MIILQCVAEYGVNKILHKIRQTGEAGTLYTFVR
jgi:hypothetical protein